VVFGITDAALGAGPIADLAFTPRAGATGTVTLVGSEQFAANLAGDQISGTSMSNGTFAIGASAPGLCEDVTNNGTINVSDALRIIDVIVGKRSNSGREDVTGNGTVNISDALRVIDVIVGKRSRSVNCP
jgi:hypothetical protein